MTPLYFPQVTVNCMFVAVMAFFARISDTSVGGTYMTLLNTFTNLGGNWPSWVALRFVSEITWKSCFGAESVPFCNKEEEKLVGINPSAVLLRVCVTRTNLFPKYSLCLLVRSALTTLQNRDFAKT